MQKFKVYQDGNKDFFVDTDNYCFAENIAREKATRDNTTMIIERTQGNKIESVFIGKYEIYSNAKGYSIQRKGQYNRWEYLKSLYNGKAVFVSDHTHQKHYKTIASAKRAVNSIM